MRIFKSTKSNKQVLWFDHPELSWDWVKAAGDLGVDLACDCPEYNLQFHSSSFQRDLGRREMAQENNGKDSQELVAFHGSNYN
jgi:hypothetical protein